MAAMHAELERLIKAEGLTYTFIRPGLFASNVAHWWAPQIRSGDVVRWPYAAAATAPIDERDVARVAARTLYQDGFASGDYVLTGPESLTHVDQMRIIGEASINASSTTTDAAGTCRRPKPTHGNPYESVGRGETTVAAREEIVGHPSAIDLVSNCRN